MQVIIGPLQAPKPVPQPHLGYPHSRYNPPATPPQAAPAHPLHERASLLVTLASALPAAGLRAAPLACENTAPAQASASASTSAQATAHRDAASAAHGALQAVLANMQGQRANAAVPSKQVQSSQNAASKPAAVKVSASLPYGMSNALIKAVEAAQDSMELRMAVLLAVTLTPPQHPWFHALLQSTLTSLNSTIDQGPWSIKPPAGARADLANFLRSNQTSCHLTDPTSLPGARKLAEAITGSRYASAEKDVYVSANKEWTAHARGAGSSACVTLCKLLAQLASLHSSSISPNGRSCSTSV